LKKFKNLLCLLPLIVVFAIFIMAPIGQAKAASSSDDIKVTSTQGDNNNVEIYTLPSITPNIQVPGGGGGHGGKGYSIDLGKNVLTYEVWDGGAHKLMVDYAITSKTGVYSYIQIDRLWSDHYVPATKHVFDADINTFHDQIEHKFSSGGKKDVFVDIYYTKVTTNDANGYISFKPEYKIK
jgi:hypothetical protein